jgi:hypothetical protein
MKVVNSWTNKTTNCAIRTPDSEVCRRMIEEGPRSWRELRRTSKAETGLNPALSAPHHAPKPPGLTYSILQQYTGGTLVRCKPNLLHTDSWILLTLTAVRLPAFFFISSLQYIRHSSKQDFLFSSPILLLKQETHDLSAILLFSEKQNPWENIILKVHSINQVFFSQYHMVFFEDYVKNLGKVS